MNYPSWMELLPGWKNYHEILLRIHHRGEVKEYDLPRGLYTPLEIYEIACKNHNLMIERQNTIDAITARLKS